MKNIVQHTNHLAPRRESSVAAGRGLARQWLRSGITLVAITSLLGSTSISRADDGGPATESRQAGILGSSLASPSGLGLPGCVGTATAFSNNTPVAIPTGPAVISSNVTVSGVGPYL